MFFIHKRLTFEKQRAESQVKLGKFDTLSYAKKIQSGRTMIEMLAILGLIGILTYLGLKGFDRMMDLLNRRQLPNQSKRLFLNGKLPIMLP